MFASQRNGQQLAAGLAWVWVASLGGIPGCSDAEPDPIAALPEPVPPEAGTPEPQPIQLADGGASTPLTPPTPPMPPTPPTPPPPDAGTNVPLPGCLPTRVGSGDQPLIDDFEGDDDDVALVDGRNGYEGTYFDNDSVRLSSVVGGAPGSTRARRFSGTSNVQYLTGWNLPMDGREYPSCPYDASNYVGLSFWARSAQPIENIAVVATVGALACRTVEPMTDCLQWYTTAVNLDSTWRHYELLWSDITAVGQAPQPALGDPATIANLYEFQFKPDHLGDFDFSIDDVEFLTGNCGSGVCDPQRRCPSDCCGDQTCDALESGNGPPPGLPANASYSAGLLYCALDCPLDRDGCPARDIGSVVPQTVSGNTALGEDDFVGACDTSNVPPPLGAPDSEYVFTAAEAGQYLFDATGASYQAVVYVLDGACSGAQLACSANVNGALGSSRAAVSVTLAAGQTVSVVVEGSFGARGPFELDITRLGGICPDDDLGAELPISVTGTTVGAENSVVESCGDVVSPDTTYLWTAPANGVYDFDLTGSSFDTVLQLRDGGCTGPELACNDNRGGGPGGISSRLSASLSAGQTVAISIDGRGAAGAYALAIREILCPASNIGTTLPLTQSGSTVAATDFLTPPCGLTGAPEATVAWTAPAAGTYVFDTLGSSFDTVLYVLNGETCGGAVLACNDDAPIGASQVTLPLTAGQSVIVVVDGYSAGSSGDYTLRIAAQ